MDEPTVDPLSPRESLQLITRQQDRAHRTFSNDPLVYWVPWGIAWLIGFGVFFLHYGLDGSPYVAMPAALPLIVLFGLMLAAAAWTVYTVIRSTRHIQGPGNVQVTVFGLSWPFGFLTVISICTYFRDFIPGDQIGLLWAGLSMGIAGVLYMAGAAIFQIRSMFVLGVWITVVNMIGITAGPGWHALLTSVAGGGGMLLAALWLRMRARSRS